MSRGAPAIPPPKFVQDAIIQASSLPSCFKYCLPDGELALRTALAEEMKVVYGADVDVTAQDVSLTAGCNLAFVAVVMALAQKDDEIILPVPW